MVIQIHLQSASDYLDGPTPTVEVYQGTIIDKNKHGLAGQIQKYAKYLFMQAALLLSSELCKLI